MKDGEPITHEVVKRETEKFLSAGGEITQLKRKIGEPINTANPMPLSQYLGMAQKRPQRIGYDYEG